MLFARLAAVVLAFGTCQMATAGIAADRARHGHLGRSAGNRLSASRSGAPGCDLAIRDGSQPGEVLAPTHDDGVWAPRLHAFAFSVVPTLLPPRTPGVLVAGDVVRDPTAPFAPAVPGRGPPRR
jgi:hypothetical protein